MAGMRGLAGRGLWIPAAACIAALAAGSPACTLDARGRHVNAVPSSGGGGSGSGPVEVAPCDLEIDFEDPSTHHCYRHIETPKTWHEARVDCQALGGDLVAVSTPSERDFLDSKLDQNVWSGGVATDLALCFHEWTNGEPWAPFWDGGEPNRQGNEACVELRESALFNDLDCSVELGYLCERVAPGECGDGIVQVGEECDAGMPIPGVTCEGCKVICDAGELKDPESLHCYRLHHDPTWWQSARDLCEGDSAHLAVLTKRSEAMLMNSELVMDTWIGSNNDGGGWEWVTGEPWCFQNWAIGEPSDGTEAYVEMYPGSGKWNNENSNDLGHYLCERAPLGNDPL
jgi:hypothetical protein